MGRLVLGLRTRMLLLVLLAVLPAFAAIGFSTIAERKHATQSAEVEAMNLVHLAVREPMRLVASTRDLLRDLSHHPAMRSTRIGNCDEPFAQSHKSHPYYTGFGIARIDGAVFCSTSPQAHGINIADRTYFRRAVQSRHFSVGGYQIGRVTGKPVVAFGYPLLREDNTVYGVLYATLNLERLHEVLRGIDLISGATVSVIDDTGTVLARYPDAEKWIGRDARDTPLISAVIGSSRSGTLQTKGLDGIERLYAFMPLREYMSGALYVIVGIPTSVTYARVNREFARDLFVLAIVATLALAAAWFGSGSLVRRMQVLARAAERLSKGDLSVRTGLPYAGEELGQVARGFDEMAGSLQRVHRSLRTLSAVNRVTARANDEQELLNLMCRAIVETGGYRMSWIGYAENETKTVRAMSEFGYEGGLPVLLKASSTITWAGDTQFAQGAVGTALRDLKPCVLHDYASNPRLAPWRDDMLRRGCASVAAFPLRVAEGQAGSLAIYAADVGSFGTEELEVLQQAAEDLSYGIANLRARDEGERARTAVQRLAQFDRLTGLPNHTSFENHLRQSLSQADARNESLSLLMFGLDRFREINDVLGFHHGDLLLREVGMRIRAAMGREVMVARLRGDEFALTMNLRETAQAIGIAHRVLDALRTPFFLDGLQLDITGTVGIAVFPQHAGEATQLMRCADVALQQGKKTGKEYVFYAPEQDEGSKRRLALAGELRRAIEAGELLLHYQPKLDISTMRVCGMEALVRWMHPLRGMIRPDEFISLAEYTGLIGPLTEWVLSEAMRQSSLWHIAGIELPIAVNLSTRNLRDADLFHKLKSLFATYDASADWLELEITEGAVMEDPKGSLEVLNRLSGLGIKLYIDDFGTGYSSLGYLNKLPMDAVKI
ncbi:MAG TPA: EAL domain-containing protein, partial [Burkholderiales bacterium]|nr:EAL domain-containing protein [Burkholderiales bacterium]